MSSPSFAEESVQNLSSLDGTFPGLTLESTLQELPLHAYQIEAHCFGKQAVKVFEENLLLPGIILTQQKTLAGMISRRRFLEEMSRPYGLDLFLNRPLQVLYSFTSAELSVFPGDTLVSAATQDVLKRSPEQLYEPVVVQLAPQTYRLLDVYQLLVAQSQIHNLARKLLDEKTQAQIFQAEKMASLGRMVAGVAHEIFNPINFISGNIGYLTDYINELTNLLHVYDAEVAQPSAKLTHVKETIGLDFLLQDLPQIINSMKLGTDRLKDIAGSLRNFSHMHEGEHKPVDIHACIDNTLLILNNRIKNKIEISKQYGNLPLVNCHFGQISQVFMNIIGNAIDALLEKTRHLSNSKQPNLLSTPSWTPNITISTSISLDADSHQPPDPSISAQNCDRWISIVIADNGFGISKEIQSRIFETFFTTKPVGEGTGLGLPISHQLVVEKHGGKINLNSQEGVGTEFQILLPLLND